MTAVAKRLAKRVLARGLLGTGGWDAVLSRWARRDMTVVVAYHRVLEKWEPALDYSQPGMVVTAPTFERQLAFLRRHFEVVPLGALLDDPAPPARADRPRCVITFDDGWRDTYDVAFPILRRQGIPAVVYLTTDFVGTDRVFWHTALIHLLMHADLSGFLRLESALVAFPKAVQDLLRQSVGSGPATRAEDVDGVIEGVKALCQDDVIPDLIRTLARAAGLEAPLFPQRRFFLDWEQVRELAAGGFEIGSHGCSHRIMTRLSNADAEQELIRSKAEIERRIGREVVHFAFPNEDVNGMLLILAARAGYRTACVGAGADRVATPAIRPLRRVGLHEGVSGAGPGVDDALLGLALMRAPKSQPA